MAEELLVNREDIGRNLLGELDKHEFPVDAMMWIYYPEVDRWRLLLSTPKIEKAKKEQDLLLEIDRISEKSEKPLPNLTEIKIVRKDEPIIKAVSAMIGTEYFSVIEMSNCSFNGVYIDKLIAYRILCVKE